MIVWPDIFAGEANPTGSRPSDLGGLQAEAPGPERLFFLAYWGSLSIGPD